MGKPILLLVNQPGRVLDALAGDLSRRFGPILPSSSNRRRRRRWRHLRSSRQVEGGRPTHRGPAMRERNRPYHVGPRTRLEEMAMAGSASKGRPPSSV